MPNDIIELFAVFFKITLTWTARETFASFGSRPLILDSAVPQKRGLIEEFSITGSSETFQHYLVEIGLPLQFPDFIPQQPSAALSDDIASMQTE